MNAKKEKRQQEIEDYIQLKKEANFDELLKEFEVNKITLHRDITEIEKRGKIKKVLSGAISINRSILDPSNEFYIRASKNWDEKRAISKEAIKFIQPGQLYFLDGSSTLLPFVQELSRTNLKDIKIVTPSIIFQLELSNNQNFIIIALGGELDKDNSVSAGPHAWKHIEDFYVDAFFFSVGGITKNLMLTDLKQANSMNSKLFIEHARNNILLIEHQKFDSEAYYTIKHISKINTVITSQDIKKIHLDKLKKIKNLNIIIAK